MAKAFHTTTRAGKQRSHGVFRLVDANASAPSPTKREPDLIDAIAADIAADLREYIRDMYPKAIEAASTSFLTSIGNRVRNKVEATLRGPQDEDEVRRRLDENARHRRRVARLRDTRWEEHSPEAAVASIMAGDEVDG